MDGWKRWNNQEYPHAIQTLTPVLQPFFDQIEWVFSYDPEQFGPMLADFQDLVAVIPSQAKTRGYGLLFSSLAEMCALFKADTPLFGLLTPPTTPAPPVSPQVSAVSSPQVSAALSSQDWAAASSHAVLASTAASVSSVSNSSIPCSTPVDSSSTLTLVASSGTPVGPRSTLTLVASSGTPVGPSSTPTPVDSSSTLTLVASSGTPVGSRFTETVSAGFFNVSGLSSGEEGGSHNLMALLALLVLVYPAGAYGVAAHRHNGQSWDPRRWAWDWGLFSSVTPKAPDSVYTNRDELKQAVKEALSEVCTELNPSQLPVPGHTSATDNAQANHTVRAEPFRLNGINATLGIFTALEPRDDMLVPSIRPKIER